MPRPNRPLCCCIWHKWTVYRRVVHFEKRHSFQEGKSTASWTTEFDFFKATGVISECLKSVSWPCQSLDLRFTRYCLHNIFEDERYALDIIRRTIFKGVGTSKTTDSQLLLCITLLILFPVENAELLSRNHSQCSSSIEKNSKGRGVYSVEIFILKVIFSLN